MKRQRQTELPRFIVGALATTGASLANGATVQITFTNHFVSSSGSSFNGDLTGDGVFDVRGGGAVFTDGNSNMVGGFGISQGSVMVGGGYFGPGGNFTTYIARAPGWASVGGVVVRGAGPSLRGLATINFSDLRINNGARTTGLLDMTAAAGFGDASGSLHRLIFDDASPNAPSGISSASPAFAEFVPVPEPSSLGLLALGAGGLLLRRRRLQAAA